MAGGNLYIEPILAGMIQKVDQILDVIDTKVTAQIQELQNVATIVGASANPNNVKVSHLKDTYINDLNIPVLSSSAAKSRRNRCIMSI